MARGTDGSVSLNRSVGAGDAEDGVAGADLQAEGA